MPQSLAVLESGLTLVDGVPVVSSVTLAQSFGKAHKNVLAVIREVTSNCPKSFNGLNFKPVKIQDEKGESRPAYHLTRDAFALIAMSFTGKQATLWKIRFIEAFNAMEQELKSRSAAPALPDAATLASARREAVQAVLALSPDKLARIRRAVDYASKGLNGPEVAKLLDLDKQTVWRYLAQARKLGLAVQP